MQQQQPRGLRATSIRSESPGLFWPLKVFTMQTHALRRGPGKIHKSWGLARHFSQHQQQLIFALFSYGWHGQQCAYLMGLSHRFSSLLAFFWFIVDSSLLHDERPQHMRTKVASGRSQVHLPCLVTSGTSQGALELGFSAKTWLETSLNWKQNLS